MSNPRILVVIVVLIVAGCSASAPTDSSTPSVNLQDTPPPSSSSSGVALTTMPTSTPAPTPTPPSTAIPTLTPTEILTGTPTRRADNPWGEEPIVIGIHGLDGSPVNYSEGVSEAVSFWQRNNHSDLAYSPSFVVEPSAADPHLIIRFTTTIEKCGTLADNETVGCAPVLTNTRDADRPEIIEVQRGLTNQSTYQVVRHELGHVLGLEHGEGPDQIMSPTGIVYNRIVRIHLEFDTSATAKQRDSRRQVRHALNYYADGAEGFLDEDVNFALIDERSAADIVVHFRETGGESTVSTDRGTFVIAVNGIDIDKRGWHVGYWLGVYLGAESQSELPPPFDEPDTDRRERWW